MTTTIQYTGHLVVLTCWCGVKHAVPQSLRDEQLRQHHDGHPDVLGVCCPLGHTHVPSGESESDRLRQQLKHARDRAARMAAERDQAEASRRAQKGATTRAKRRHAAGVCPVCKRTFQQVKRHMASQHPDFDPSA